MQSPNKSERYKLGWKHLKALDESAASKIQASLKKISPEMGQFIVEFAYGDVYSRPGLDVKSRQIATVAALSAMGTAPAQLRFHIGAALNVGCTSTEIIEIMYLMSVFSGFPAALNGINIAKAVFEERNIKIKNEKVVDDNKDRRDRGLLALEQTSSTSGESVVDALNQIAPEMADFIIEFAYGDVIARQVLDPKHKEIAIIASCIAMGTAEPQLKVHINAALNVGCTMNQVKETIIQMAAYAGFPASLNALKSAYEVFLSHKQQSEC